MYIYTQANVHQCMPIPRQGACRLLVAACAHPPRLPHTTRVRAHQASGRTACECTQACVFKAQTMHTLITDECLGIPMCMSSASQRSATRCGCHLPHNRPCPNRLCKQTAYCHRPCIVPQTLHCHRLCILPQTLLTLPKERMLASPKEWPAVLLAPHR